MINLAFRVLLVSLFSKGTLGQYEYPVSGSSTDLGDYTDPGQAIESSVINHSTIISRFPWLNVANDTNQIWHRLEIVPVMKYVVYWRLLHEDKGTAIWNNTASSTRIEIIFSTSFVGWVGFGLGSSNMFYLDIFLLQKGDGTNYQVYDMTSFDGNPVADSTLNLGSNDIWFGDVWESDTAVAAVARRKLNTGDPHDHVIKPGWTIVSCAWSSVTTKAQRHGPLNKANFVIDFFRGETQDGNAVGNDPDKAFPAFKNRTYSFVVFHGFIMSFSFLVLIPIGIFVARYWPNAETWIDMHRATMSLATTQVIAVGIATITSGKRQFDNEHSIMGLIVSILAVVAASLGVFGTFDWMFSARTAHSIRWTHKRAAYLLLCGGITNVILGLRYGLTGYKNILLIAILGVLGYVIFVACGLYVLQRHVDLKKVVEHLASFQSSSDVEQLKRRKNLPSFSYTELRKSVDSGHQWIVIEKLVYNVAEFMNSHPGGKKFIEDYIGNDATKAFYPDRGPTKDINAHRHSRYALARLSELLVGQFEEGKGEFQSVLLTSHEVSKEEGNVKSFTRVSPENAVDTVYSLKIDSAGAKWRVGSSVQLSIRADETAVSRHYTNLGSSPDSHEFFIKIYKDGAFTPLLKAHLSNSRTLYMSGPADRIPLHPLLIPSSKIHNCSTIVFCFAGTGVTPLLQTLNHWRVNGIDRNKVTFCWQASHASAADSHFYKDQLDSLVKHFHVDRGIKWDFNFYLSSGETEGVVTEGRSCRIVPRRIEHEDIKGVKPILDSPESIFALICGTSQYSHVIESILKSLGVPADNLYIFE